VRLRSGVLGREESGVNRSRATIASGTTLAILLGVLLGSGAFTFHYGEGLSYFSTDPQACVNCHIMQPHFDSWTKSSHRAVADCARCHLPQPFPWNYVSKADNGFFHSWAFTFQDFHEPIQIKPRNLRILEQNCLSCHADLVEAITGHAGVASAPDASSCLHCHSDVGHTSRPRMSGS